MTDAGTKLGEVLRTAREAKGVDLSRVERETKIRERYLAALENGDYDDLPGAVYTRGFLRNYGAYLGLDADELIDLYRLETSGVRVPRQTLPTPPRPLAVRRSRAFVVTPGAVVAAILTLLVGGFFAYLGYQFVTFARTPDLRITDPPSNMSRYTELEITIRGETVPNGRVTVDNLRENPTVTADADGAFEVTVGLVPGSNVVELTAFDPVTRRNSEPETRTIVVVTDDGASPSAPSLALELTEPAAGVTVRGPVTVAGRATPGATVTVTPSLHRPPTPTFEIVDVAGNPVEPTPQPPTAPAAVSLTADAGGAFTGTIALPPGAWRLDAAASTGETASASVAVAPGAGMTAEITIDGGESYLDLYEDGERVADVAGRNAQDGDTIQLAADGELRIRAGNAAVVRIRVNGIELGPMGGPGAVIEWTITRIGG